MRPAAGAPPPPFSLPGSHFAAGLGFLLLGAIGLWYAAPALASGAYLDPSVTSVTHLFTLGWITLSIMGALYQFLPVALDRSIQWPGLGPVALALYAPGLLILVSGLFGGRGGWTAAGGSLLALGALIFILNLATTLALASRRDLTWWALVFATVFFVATVVLGATLSANLRWWFLGSDRLTAIGVHLHVALVGWVLLVVVGVGHRLLPMFLLSHGADERPARWSVGLLAGGTGLLFMVDRLPPGFLRRAPAVVILLGMVAFLVQVRAFFRHRRRTSLDPGLRSVALGLLLIAAGTIVGGSQALLGLPSPRLTLTYVLAVILGLSAFVAGHYYKIVPFLVFYHRYGPLVGRRPVPQVAELYSGPAASVAGWAFAGGAASTVLGTLASALPLTYVGAGLVISGVSVQCVQMLLLYRSHPDGTSRETVVVLPSRSA